MARRLGQIRGLRVAMAALFALGQAASLGHFLLVRHAICPEHGELLHIDDDAGAAHQHLHDDLATVASADPEQTGLSRGDDRVSHAHLHEHCGVAATRRSSTALRPVTCSVDELTPSTLLLPDGGSVPFAATALLRIAPKHSPPEV